MRGGVAVLGVRRDRRGRVRAVRTARGYVPCGAVGAADADLRVSTVVEATQAGTVLIGSSRQRVGFDPVIPVAVLRALARGATTLFPLLAAVPVLRAYGGFRPYTPDHLPVIGPDPPRAGLRHAAGHEGAGIGLAAATGDLLAELLTGEPPRLDPAPFRVDRPGLRGAPEAAGGVPGAATVRPGPGAVGHEARGAAGGGVSLTVDGVARRARPGQTVAAVLLETGRAAWRTTRGERPRGVFCGIGVCHDCLVVVNGLPDVRACLREVAAGDVVETQRGAVLPGPAAGPAPVGEAGPAGGAAVGAGGVVGTSGAARRPRTERAHDDAHGDGDAHGDRGDRA